VSGNRGTPSEVVGAPFPRGGQDTAARIKPPHEGRTRSARLRGYWLTPPGLAILAATALALILRLWMITRNGYFNGITEYDDGVYLGGSVRLLQGALPYHDFAFVQPPGILLLMAPVALLTKATTTAAAMTVARILTVLASTACIPLAGNLVRYRGVLVTVVTCGILAIYPDDVATAHTVLLEPWMNLLCLLAANAAFYRGRLARPGRLAWAGVALGFAAAVKFWAAVPAGVLLVLILLARDQSGARPVRARRTKFYLAGLAAGLIIPVAPFALTAPGAFVRSTLLDQATRAGSYVPVSLRLAHLTGLIDFLNRQGRFSLHAGIHSLFAGGGAATTGIASAGWLPFGFAAVLVVVIAVGYTWDPNRPSQLEWFALATAALASLAILGYSAFFYHYPAFPGPWIALTAGGAVRSLGGRPEVRKAMIGCAAVLIVAVAALQMNEVADLGAPHAYADAAVIPQGACVVTDEISMVISANRFTAAHPGCPDIIDSLATTLVLSNGVSVQGGAQNMSSVVAAWRALLGKAQYVWLSSSNARRIPWTPGLKLWFADNFTRVLTTGPSAGDLYQRVTGPVPNPSGG